MAAEGPLIVRQWCQRRRSSPPFGEQAVSRSDVIPQGSAWRRNTAASTGDA